MRKSVGQQGNGDTPAVQWRHGKQIKDKHHHVDQHACLAHLQEEGFVQANDLQRVENDPPKQGLDEIGCRPREDHPNRVAARIAQRAEMNGNGLGIAKQKASIRRKIQKQRHRNRANGVNVLEGVERDAPQAVGCFVAKIERSISMRRLMNRDREDHGQGIDENSLNDVIEIHNGLSQTSGAARDPSAAKSPGWRGRLCLLA